MEASLKSLLIKPEDDGVGLLNNS